MSPQRAPTDATVVRCSSSAKCVERCPTSATRSRDTTPASELPAAIDAAFSRAATREAVAAMARGDVTYGRNGGRLIGHYFCTPWAAIYEAARPVMIGDTPIPRGKRFTIECAAEGVRVGYPFKREVVVGDFKPSRLDYCDPDAPPPHDD